MPCFSSPFRRTLAALALVVATAACQSHERSSAGTAPVEDAVPAAVPAAGAAAAHVELPGEPRPPVASQEVVFWRARTGRDEYDYISRIRLANALMTDARRSGDESLYAQAERHLMDALRVDPSSRDALVSLAFARSAQHRPVEALDVAERAYEIDPTDDGVLAALGDARLELGETALALQAYERIAANDRGSFVLTRLANVAHAEGRDDDVLALLAEAADVGAERGSPAHEVARCHFLAGDLHFQRGRFAEAEAKYNAALELWPDGYLPIEHMAELRAAEGRLTESLSLYEQAIELAPHPDLLEAMADVAEAAGDRAAASQLRDRAHRKYEELIGAGDTGHFGAYALFLAETRGDPAAGLPFAERDAEQRPTTRTLLVLAHVQRLTGVMHGALATLDRALTNSAGEAVALHHPDLLWYAGAIEHAAGRRAAAIRHLEAALTRCPHHAERETIERLLGER